MRATGKSLFAFGCGLHFALLQFSYFFLTEAFLTSQYLSFFVTLFFWLCGFLVGLNLRGGRWFLRLLLGGAAAYYLSWLLTRLIPFHGWLYPSVAICSVASGLLPGWFFPFLAGRFQPVRRLLFHENNGFLLGILMALKAAIHCGSWFLALAPLLGACLVLALHQVFAIRSQQPIAAPLPASEPSASLPRV